MRRSLTEGWILVLSTALGVGGMVVVLFATYGIELATVQRNLVATARISLVLFVLAFSASALRRVWRVPATAWLLRNRRYLGVSFATSHGIHLGLIASLGYYTPERFTAKPAELVPGFIAYAFLAAMTLTSFDRTAAWLGKKRWRLLHLVGSWWIWFVFTAKYTTYVTRGTEYIVIASALYAVAALRVAVAIRGGGARRRRAAS